MRNYFEVDEQNPLMWEARKVAEAQSLDPDWPTGAVVVKDGKVIGRGANGSEYHRQFGCDRKRRGLPTGEGYEFCQGCHPKNHAEARAVKGIDAAGAAVYLWGHWWCCESCWQVMIDAGVKKVYLVKGANVRFNQVRHNSAN